MLAWKQLFIQRVRNSSLVERGRVDDDRASRPQPKPRTRTDVRVVGEHSGRRRRRAVRRAGASGKENVGMSNDNEYGNIHTENPRFPGRR